jgi:tyrosyl-tRNA synthetase
MLHNLNKKKMTKIYKNIQMDVEQISTSIMVFEKFINNEQKDIKFFTDKLNGCSSTKEVRQFQNHIRSSKEKITGFKNLIVQMSNNQFITKHTL